MEQILILDKINVIMVSNWKAISIVVEWKISLDDFMPNINLERISSDTIESDYSWNGIVVE